MNYGEVLYIYLGYAFSHVRVCMHYFNLICEVNDVSVMWFIKHLWETTCLTDLWSLTVNLFLDKRSCLYIPYNLKPFST